MEQGRPPSTAHCWAERRRALAVSRGPTALDAPESMLSARLRRADNLSRRQQARSAREAAPRQAPSRKPAGSHLPPRAEGPTPAQQREQRQQRDRDRLLGAISSVFRVSGAAVAEARYQ